MILLSKIRKYKWWVSQKAERLWWRRYLKDKSPEEYLQWKREYWYNFLALTGVQVNNNDLVYDAGCGPAGVFTILNESQVIAVDSLLNNYNQLTQFNKEDYPNVRFISSRIEEYLNTAGFDIIFCVNAINHVEDIDLALSMLNKNLKAEGSMVLTTDVHRSNFLKKLFQLFPGDILHPHQYNRADYEKMLKEHNFVMDKIITLKSGTIFDYCAFIVSKLNKDIEVQG